MVVILGHGHDLRQVGAGDEDQADPVMHHAVRDFNVFAVELGLLPLDQDLTAPEPGVSVVHLLRRLRRGIRIEKLPVRFQLARHSGFRDRDVFVKGLGRLRFKISREKRWAKREQGHDKGSSSVSRNSFHQSRRTLLRKQELQLNSDCRQSSVHPQVLRFAGRRSPPLAG